MRLASWNIQWARGCDGIVSVRRISDTLRAQGDADVICLQEVATGFDTLPGLGGDDQVTQFAAEFPQYRPVFAPGSDRPDEGGRTRQFGNLILSRLPVTAVWRRLLPWPADPTVPSMQRSVAEVSVLAPLGPMRVLTTHLEYYSAAQRLAQVEALRALSVEALAHARRPPAAKDTNPAFAAPARPAAALLCGDLNCTPDSEAFRRLIAPTGDEEANWHDLWSYCHPREAHAHTVGLHGADWPDHPYCCDFALATAALLPHVSGIEVDAATDASDHQPVWVELGR